ncbi:hypothetical protein MKX08_004869 [Trichoderma sp. CBMAI-0020]|nr:hypothetical protein MKX08_004869 [Trichoderma sp. CBMAI-0020]
MGDRIFRIFNPREPKGDPVEKRRAQLRRAQHNYRERKDKYTKALEAELARSRRNEAGLATEVQQLRARVYILNSLLSQNGISLPPEFAEDISHGYTLHMDDSSPASEQAQTAIRPLEELQLDPTSKAANQSSPSSSDGFNLRHHGSRFFRKPLPPVPTATITLSAKPSDKTHLSELDATTVGMEFVLTLERPCLGHVHGNPKKPNEPGGHALTATVQLQSALSLPPIDPQNPKPPPYQQAPAAVLDRLLNLAPSVSEDGDVTPIQAWHYIRHQPQFGGFEIQNLNRLAEKLLVAMKCHGFGAAIQPSLFESTVRETLSSASLMSP